jgi:putative transposase
MGYPSDLTDSEWDVIAPLLPQAKAGGRPRTTSLRQILNAVNYISRGGCAWRMLPKDFPPYQTVYDYFRSWRNDGTWSGSMTSCESVFGRAKDEKRVQVLPLSTVRAPRRLKRGAQGL